MDSFWLIQIQIPYSSVFLTENQLRSRARWLQILHLFQGKSWDIFKTGVQYLQGKTTRKEPCLDLARRWPCPSSSLHAQGGHSSSFPDLQPQSYSRHSLSSLTVNVKRRVRVPLSLIPSKCLGERQLDFVVQFCSTVSFAVHFGT